MTDNTVTGPAVGFLGRRCELAALRADIERAGLDTLAGRPVSRARVLLVAGPPGSGRTALAEEFAAEQLASGAYPGGLLRVRLTEPGGTPVPAEHAARELLGALDIAAPPGAGDDDLTSIVRRALTGRSAVLLLDDAASAEQLDAFVPDSRDCLVLAVAGGPLTGLPGVRPCTVGGLRTPDAVRLLARRAGDVRVTVDPTAAERLAEVCGHLPAALVLVGGWLAACPEATVVDALRRVIAVAGEQAAPAGNDGTPPPLRWAFRLACTALPAPAARMLPLLALAPAGFADAHTAAALAGCSVRTARGSLADLARLGLLRPAAHPEEERYQVPGCLLPLLHAELQARERPSDILLARARVLERTVRQLGACRAVTEPSGSPARVWLSGLPAPLRFGSAAAAADWLAARLPAHLAAARLAAADGRLDTLARRLVAALCAALTAHRGEEACAAEVYRLHELSLSVAERQGLPREAAATLLILGEMDTRAGRFSTALDRYRAALHAARSGPGAADQGTAWRALAALGGTYAELGDWQRSADWYGRALAVCQSRDDLDGAALLHARIGTALGRAGQWQEALRAWRAAAAAHRRRGDVRAQARALAEAARVQERAGRPEEAMRTAREALRQAERAGDARLGTVLRLRLSACAEQVGGHAVPASRDDMRNTDELAGGYYE